MDQMDVYEAVKFEQLAIGNSSNVLYYSRDKYSSVLARKLKPEFSRFYISSEFKDCMKMLSKITNDRLDGNNIDIILADSDTSTLKLIDYINKRPITPETSNCPLIPIIILTSDSLESDFTESLRNAGNVNKFIKTPCKTKDILFSMIEVLHTRRQIEETFKDLKKTKIMTSKYPYLPIFTNEAVTTKNDQNKNNSYTSQHSDNTSSHKNTIEEIDDGTECSSLLPNFVTNSRLKNPTEFDHRVAPSHTAITSNNTVNTNNKTITSNNTQNTIKLSHRALGSKFDQLDTLITKESYDLELAAHNNGLDVSKTSKNILDKQMEEGDTNMDTLLNKLKDGTPVKLEDMRCVNLRCFGRSTHYYILISHFG